MPASALHGLIDWLTRQSDGLIALGNTIFVKNLVLAILAMQILAACGILVWAKARGFYDAEETAPSRQVPAAAFLRAFVGILHGFLAAIRNAVFNAFTNVRFGLKLLAFAGLVALFVVDFDRIGVSVLNVLTKFVLIALSIYATRHLVFGIVTALARVPWKELRVSTYEPSVLILIPCHNEASVVERLLTNLVALEYPPHKLSIVIIDDASSDATGELALACAERLRTKAAGEGLDVPAIHIHQRPKGIGGKGKSAALNSAIELFDVGEIICVFDADHKPESDCLRRMVRHYEEPAVGAFMGRCIPMNRNDNLISFFVYLEYLVGYRGNMFAREVMKTVPAFGGSNCSIRRSLLLETVGLFKEGCLAEDTELTMCVYEAGYVVRYDATARNYEEATNTLSSYIKQRTRWARGHDQVSLAHTLRTILSPSMTLRRKIEGFLFLQVYWMPVIYIIGVVLSIVHYFFLPLFEFPYWAFIYFFVSATLEVVASLARDREPIRSWLSLPLFPAFSIIGMYIAARAAWDHATGRTAAWEKTPRSADGQRNVAG